MVGSCYCLVGGLLLFVGWWFLLLIGGCVFSLIGGFRSLLAVLWVDAKNGIAGPQAQAILLSMT